MASKNISIYVTDRTLSGVRPGESVSPRLNRIVDRYLELVEQDASYVREGFTDEQWPLLVAAWQRLNDTREGVLAMNARAQLMRELGPGGASLAEVVRTMIGGDFVVMLELLEREYISRKIEAASTVAS